ncbi:hypothetical protein EDD17DRAFT_913528 [Pisolithus thermaeus]|nr:hypothetical protein EDD17DRAFT_913528 [Pisolithus thermaeus]
MCPARRHLRFSGGMLPWVGVPLWSYGRCWALRPTYRARLRSKSAPKHVRGRPLVRAGQLPANRFFSVAVSFWFKFCVYEEHYILVFLCTIEKGNGETRLSVIWSEANRKWMRPWWFIHIHMSTPLVAAT